MKKWIPGLLLLCILFSMRGAALAEEVNTDKMVQMMFYGQDPVTVVTEGDPCRIDSLALGIPLKTMYYTFDTLLPVGGTADENVKILSVMYTAGESGRPIIWYQNESQVNRSHLYQENIPIALVGRQKLWIGVTTDQGTTARIYMIERKSSETESTLTDFYLNLYEEYGR
ncbi:MAG: hypothetical protein K6A77_01255 [Clostridiales bacterium]|nr:hypothetical protein [Clostridiales bacterium]